MRQKQQLRHYRRGAAAVEFAFLAPFLCFLFVIAVDYARIFYASLTIANCARNGALYGSRDKTSAVDTAGIETAAKADATNLNTSKVNVTSTTDGGTPATYVDVTVTYPFTTITSWLSSQTITITRTVRMKVVPDTPNFS
jgi:Flp pilus assembly protein TadG